MFLSCIPIYSGSSKKFNSSIHTERFGWCSTAGGGVVFHLYPLTPFTLKLDGSNFAQEYFGVR